MQIGNDKILRAILHLVASLKLDNKLRIEK